MSNKPLVFTIDFGTQSLRVALTDKDGNIVAIEKIPYNPAYYSDKKGYAEQDADFYWNNLIVGAKNLCEKNKDKLKDIVGATITTFRDTAVLLDAKNKPIRRSILWLDQRMAEAKEKLPFYFHIAFFLSGMTETIKLNRRRTIAHWLKENEPETWSKTKKYVNISTYLTYKLTGLLVDSSSNYTGHYPVNYKTGKWRKENALKAKIFGIPPRMLCELRQPGSELGVISDEVAELFGLPKGIMLYASGSDKACETLGLGSITSDVGAISYGTASTIEVANKKYHEPELFLPGYQASVPNLYNLEVQIYRGYWMLSWFTKEFASSELTEATIQDMTVLDVLNSRLSSIPPGSDGLVLQPYWGPGLKRPLVKGSIIGFSDIHTREHLYRAIIEGIAYALREGLESIEKSQKKKIKSLMISGGGSQSSAICQITADIFGLPVSRVQTFETTTLGAAISCMVAAGVYSSTEEAVEHMVHTSDTFNPNVLAHQQYQYLYHYVYLNMYPRLKNIYRHLKWFDKRY